MVWDSSCYYLVQQSMSQSDASAACNVLGSHLAVITSAAENAAITNYLQTTGYTNWVHLGATDNAVEGTYVWETGEAFVYLGWEIGQPQGGSSENCCVTRYDGKWHDVNCNSLVGYLCEI